MAKQQFERGSVTRPPDARQIERQITCICVRQNVGLRLFLSSMGNR